MALKSMTGYGRGEATTDGRTWIVEVRSVNNRFLDAKMKLPRDYTGVEDRIRKMVADFHQRGRVDLLLSVTGDFSDLVDVHINTGLARTYKTSLENLAGQLKLEDPITLAMLAGFPDVIVREQKREDIETVLPFIVEAVTAALDTCNEMRTLEAAALVQDLSERLVAFSAVLDEVEKKIPDLLEKRELGLNDRLEKLLGSVALDPLRLAQEVAVIADKTDVTEELVRLRSHIVQFEGMLQASGAVGRKLDFLIQEFLREVNTMASKINDAEIAHMMVDLKSELEKMREQVQNIE